MYLKSSQKFMPTAPLKSKKKSFCKGINFWWWQSHRKLAINPLWINITPRKMKAWAEYIFFALENAEVHNEKLLLKHFQLKLSFRSPFYSQEIFLSSHSLFKALCNLKIAVKLTFIPYFSTSLPCPSCHIPWRHLVVLHLLNILLIRNFLKTIL